MVTVTRSNALRIVGGDGLRGPWDTVEEAQAERLSTVPASVSLVHNAIVAAPMGQPMYRGA